MKRQKFIEGLLTRKGQWILSSSLLTKFSGLLLSLIIVRILSVDDYGIITLYKTIFLFLTPLVGLGLNHSLLRYGALSSDRDYKIELLFNTILLGITASFGVGCVVFYLLPHLPNLFFNSSLFLFAFMFYQGLFVLNSIFNFYRIIDNNKAYSLLSATFSLITLFFTCMFVYFLETPSAFFIGQLVSIFIFLIGLIYIKMDVIKNTSFTLVNALLPKLSHIKYGISVALGSLASQLMLASDNLMLSIMGQSLTEIGLYGVCSLIFVNILFIPSVILVTDFVYLSKLPFEKVKKYLFDYWFFIVFPLIAICLIFIFWGGIVLKILFGEAYFQAGTTLKILTIGMFFGVMFRVPIGNLLNAKGLASFNVLISIVFCFVNIILNYIFIPVYGINGAAFATAITICISSLISLLYLFFKLKA